MRFWQADGEIRKTPVKVKTRMRQLTEQGFFSGEVAPFGHKLVKSGEINKKGKELLKLKIVPHLL